MTEQRCDLNVEKEPDLEMVDILSEAVWWDRYTKVDDTFKQMYEYNFGIPFGHLTTGID